MWNAPINKIASSSVLNFFVKTVEFYFSPMCFSIIELMNPDVILYDSLLTTTKKGLRVSDIQFEAF